MAMISIVDFTTTPGGRDKDDGEFSGQEFREKFLEPHFNNPQNAEQLLVNLDGTLYGFPPSFIDEAFGGLARKFGVNVVLGRVQFVSTKDQLLIDEIMDCIKSQH